MWARSQGREDALEVMATHSSIPAWRIPWTEEPGRLQFLASQSWTQLLQVGMHTCRAAEYLYKAMGFQEFSLQLKRLCSELELVERKMICGM